MVQSSGTGGISSSILLAGTIGLASGIVMATVFRRATNPVKKVSAKNGCRNYKPGQKPSLPSATFGKQVEVFDPSKLNSCYKLMISTAIPRPIAFVSSRSKETGVDNVSPFSYFGLLAHNPPTVAVGFCRKGRDKIMKDSLSNVMETKEFALNIISEWFLDAANHTCGDFKPDVDEFAVSGLTKSECLVVAAPRVAEAAVAYECQVQHTYPVADDDGNPTTEIVIARVVRVHADRDVLVSDFDPKNPVVDEAKVKPLGRLGGNTYCELGNFIDIPRPKV